MILFGRTIGTGILFIGVSLFAGNLTQAEGLTDVALNRAAYHSSAADHNNVAQLATDGSDRTYWQSLPEDQPWIYVDLGSVKKIQGVRLTWGASAPAGCSIEVSTDASTPATWASATHLSCTAAQVAQATFAPMDARFVRMMSDKGGAPQACQLAEFEVLSPAVPKATRETQPLAAPDEEGKIFLENEDWTLQNTLFTHDSGENISSPSFDASSWLPAKVPGTVITSYLRAGAIPDPNFGSHQRLISESFFQNDFWYREQFIAPTLSQGQHLVLNFSGINWKAEMFLNGAAIGKIAGAFRRGDFDITDRIKPGQQNCLAVLIHCCPHPGPTNEKSLSFMSHNGGVLGLDSPTFVASQGWNWVPAIRGRDIGIWDHVFLRQTGGVVLTDPFVHTTVSSDLHQADVTVEVTAHNLDTKPLEATVQGKLGSAEFHQVVSLGAGESKTVKWEADSTPALRVSNPPLWWPNGYGDQPLQQLRLDALVGQSPSSSRLATFGFRTLSYDTSNKILKLLCNGKPLQLNGGNWGMDESMLRYEARDYDTAVHLHKDMNMVMIRNWVGQVGKEEFFDACDKYGILVWNDFWLANPADGPNPADNALFMDNVRDRIARIRNHPSLALYCGRNEGNPPKELDMGMETETKSLDGTRYYIPNSAAGLVTGHGPYEPREDDWYFKSRGTTLHSELGIVCVPTAETMREMMPAKDLWPISDMWGLHDFAQVRDRIYTKRIDTLYGESQSLDEFCRKAQMQNWDNAKAMFEAWRSNSGSGGIVWMSQAAWPSLICQFYDYYLNPTGAYFGAKSANEPLHVLWDCSKNEVRVANNTGKDFSQLRVEAAIYNMDGTRKASQEAQVDSAAGGKATTCFQLTLPADLSPVHFIKLKLSLGSQVLSENFYWRGVDQQKLQDLNHMEPVTLTGRFTADSQGTDTVLKVHLENSTQHVAVLPAVRVVRASHPEVRVLPLYFSENYVSLLPGEQRDSEIHFDSSALQGDKPELIVEGWNVTRLEVKN